VELTLVCSPEEAIIEVMEPSICVYDMVMHTPLACDDGVLKAAARKVQEIEATLKTGTQSSGHGETSSGNLKEEL
jgi:hypothetical protein